MRVFWRGDVSAVRAVLRPGAPPITRDIVHVELYFFLDLDLVPINVEVSARDLALAQTLELLYRFGRGYSASWDAEGHAQHCLYSATSSWPMSAATARRASQPTGSGCLSFW
jgi:hypothetical protein